jgi:diguanylate cyclase (GGDEF)-like protein
MLFVRSLSSRTHGQKLLLAMLLAVLPVHAFLLAVLASPALASRLCTAWIALMAGAAGLWRSARLPRRERTSWWWVAATLALWGAAQIVEAMVSRSTSASNLAADPADFFYLIAAFPLLLALSNTGETESIRGIFALNVSQAFLACGLTYVRLFRMQVTAAAASDVMLKIYAAECTLLAVAGTLRLVSWSSAEERRRMRLLCGALWIYLPIELSLDYATRRWHLQIGTMLDLLWSLPFLYAGWQALHLPMDEDRSATAAKPPGRLSRLLESLCPMLITAGVFALAVSILSQHVGLAILAMCLLLLLQALHSGLVQLNYLAGQDQLLEQEEALRQANMSLQRLSLLDPLTGIPNRRQFTATLDAEWRRADRRGDPIAMLMIDVDFFKAVNDLHGHIYGDECLVRIAHLCRDALRMGNDMLARYGGEEFIILLPGSGLDAAMVVAERMQASVTRAGLSNDGSPFDKRLTVSIGVSVSRPVEGHRPAVLIAAADQALYEAKRSGRNRVCVRDCVLEPVRV